MQTLSELLNGGLVTARHPSLLAEGELQRADDTVLRDDDPALWRAPGRQVRNSIALGTKWAGAAQKVKGIAHLTFERTRYDQLLAFSGTVLSRACLAASDTGVIDAIGVQIACTTDGTVNVTSSSLFGPVREGWAVYGTNIAPGTTVKTVTSVSAIVLSRKATGSGSTTLTFNPMQEISGGGQVAGTIAGAIFTATTGYPFTADVVGARVFSFGTPSLQVLSVSGESGTTGHYNAVTLSATLTPGGITLTFLSGIVQTFTNNGTRDEILDFTQYGGSYFVWLGRGPLQRLYWSPRAPVTDGTENVPLDDALFVRSSGLNPVVSQLTAVEVSNASYTWPVTLATGFYWFLCTEIYDPNGDGSNEVESSYVAGTKPLIEKAEPVAVALSALTGKAIQITFPTRINTGETDSRISTHWGLYMYGPTDDGSAIPSLAAFRRIAKVQMNAASGQTYLVYESRLFQQKFATVATDTGGSPLYPRWTNDTAMFGDGYASAKSGPSTDGSEQSAPCETLLTTFGFTNPGATILGIRVVIRGRANPSGNAGTVAAYYARVKSGAKSTGNFLGDFGTNWTENWHGGETDTMGVAWDGSDLAGLSVLIGKTNSGRRERLEIDYVQLNVFFQTGSVNLNGPPFRTVTLRNQVGDTISEPAKGVAPNCSTGDIFQGSLVLNDLSDETAIRFSLPGNPEAFPKPYVMRFNTTKRKDRVTFIKTLGQVLIVGLENGIRRVMYLPTEQDTDSREGVAHEPIASDHGIPGPLAATVFDWPGRGTVLVYASYAGIMMTDGITTSSLNGDLDWPATVNFAALSSAVIRVYPKEKWIILYYCPAGAAHTKNTRALVFSYADDHIKNGQLPCTGPLSISGRSSCELMLNGYPYLFTGHETNGFVYQEDYGVAQASGYQVHNTSDSLVDAPIVPFVRTRRMHPVGITRETRIYKAYLLFSAYGTTTSVNTCVVTKNSTTITHATSGFTNIVKGMRVKGAGLDEGTIVVTATAGSITVSRAANTTQSAATLTFDTGTISVTNRGLSIGESAAGMSQQWNSTLTGDMIVSHIDAARQGIELQIEKVPITFSTDADGYRFDSATWADLGVDMRLHQLMLQYDDLGPENTRSVA